MKHISVRLRLHRETLRTLSRAELQRAGGGVIAITDGNNGCKSEATGCASICEWSCLNMSCLERVDP